MKKAIFTFLTLGLCFFAGAQENYYNEIITKVTDNKLVHGTSFMIQSGDKEWKGSTGNLNNESQYFIASTTKLYVTAVVMQLREEGKLQLDDKISLYLDAETMKNLHVIDGKDYSNEITIKQLLAQTSGLPDYFQGKKTNGKSIRQELSAGIDQSWTFEDAISISKTMKPKFAPGNAGKAFYSDTNYQLLGRIIENITKSTFADQVQERICKPLQLTKTYLYTDPTDTKPVNIYYKKNALSIPKSMASVKADGGIVSTSSELMEFLIAFMEGDLFPVEYLTEMRSWNKIFYPLQYGVGVSRFKLGKFATLGKDIPEVIGHSGLSGTVAFYSPEKNLYIVGTVNQIHKPSTSFKVLVKMIMATR
jgi:CubicO group peptidase (beta-lactamase class C family)